MTDTAREYTHPSVLTAGVRDGWADPETDPALIDWRPRQAAALIPFAVVGGRPVSPFPPTGIERGRNGLGRWGENPMADAIVTAALDGTRHLLMVQRGDGGGWAVPGGSIEQGETGAQAAARELAEETGLELESWAGRAAPPRHVPDPRASDEAWAVTVPVSWHLGDVVIGSLPVVTGADDARRAEWIPAASYDGLAAALAARSAAVFAAHQPMLRDYLG